MDDLQENIFYNLIDSNELVEQSEIILQTLIEFLDENDILYNYSVVGNYIEIINEPNVAEFLITNFDIIYSINSYSAGVVEPNLYNQTQKGFGFEIILEDENLPIIGVIDTGIEKTTPLNSIIINDDSFNLTDSSSLIDEVDHGTAVAAIASIGSKLYPNHFGTHIADARLLSMKVLNEHSNILFKEDVIEMIRRAHHKYDIKIFTLTIGSVNFKKHNERVSEYGAALDRLSHELGLLIFIAIGNNNNLLHSSGSIINFPEVYDFENSNLCSPAESMNNFTVGAYSDNFENNSIERISHIGTTPALYSRTFHYNWQLQIFLDKNGNINHRRTNSLLFKPDAICHGGDYDLMIDPSKTGLKILSSIQGIYFSKNVGTSYASPFAANLASKIIYKYPLLKDRMQTVKALMINSCKIPEPNENFDKISTHTIGNGLPNETFALNSNLDIITIILEDEILPETLKCFSLKLPGYLIDLEHKNQSILNIKSTLCFSFEPNCKSEFTYCPIHLSFILTDNLDLEKYDLNQMGEIIKERGLPVNSYGLNNNNADKIKLKNSWSQDYYYKSKILSNVQKTFQNLTRKDLIKNIDEEGNIHVKLAVNCKLHKLLNALDKYDLEDIPIKYSLVISIEELPYKNETSGKLYDELSALNTLENIISSDLDTELEAEN